MPDAAAVPLRWPVDPAAMTDLQKFLMWTPLIGPQVRIRRGLLRQLKARPADCMRAWDAFPPDKAALAVRIAAILKDALDWPHARFIPDDPFGILLWDRFGDMADVTAVMAIEEAMGFGIEEGTWRRWMEGGTFGEVVDALIALRERHGSGAS
jgi:hypothetical protein